MTNNLAERMVGHRTRLAQENPSTWHLEEDESLFAYLRLSERVDLMALQLDALLSRGWLLVGMLGIVAPFIANPEAIGRIAISLGGIMLASQALTQLTDGMQSIGGMIIAWDQAAPLYKAAARPIDTSNLSANRLGNGAQRNEGQRVMLSGRDISFRYRERGRDVLHECQLEVREGQRILLEGASGGGKSTLAAILTGLRDPQSGLLLLQGFDRQTVGTALWRQRVVLVPQFHENHVFTDTLAFNLLMGKRWPPEPEDLQEAEIVCHELGLGDLLQRMPGGMQQMVGESGWRLSHGERSRIYVARALLQEPDIVILDESFGALDPENLSIAMECAHRRAATLMVIAHP